MRPNVPEPSDRGGVPQAAPVPDTPRSRIAEEHRVLRLTLARIETLDEPGALLRELRALRPLLAEHFAGEEAADGLHRVIDATAPHRIAEVHELFAEHRECLATIDRLCDTLAELIAGPVAALRSEVAELCGSLHRHEAAETELLSNALYEELGGSG